MTAHAYPQDGQAIAALHMSELAEARRLLENPGYAARMTNLIGMPLEQAVRQLPAQWAKRISDVTANSLNKCMNMANFTLRARPRGAIALPTPSPRLHTTLAAVSGAAGGVFGLAGLALELPVSTMVMLRSIADIGRSEGEDLATVEAQMACLMVFSLGGKAASDDGADSGYYAARVALAKAMAEATVYISRQGVAREGAPALARLIGLVAARFNVQVSQKAAAMLVPVIGAAGGALINTLFIRHFQDMARGHFTVRRLERLYGAERIATAYRNLSA